jgi:3-deoxy-manno-octulosonate cytidylyltransferase (CMP-KDO synthetase)
MHIYGIIPARYASSRFPGKPLVDILGKPMIQRVYEQALQAKKLDQVIVATDDARIAEVVTAFGGRVAMSSDQHPSGTDRCAEVAQQLGVQEHDVVINIQGDEPFIDPEQIDTLCRLFESPEVQLGTLVRPFGDVETLRSDSSIKVVRNVHGDALYFSRSVIPFVRETADFHLGAYWQHIGIYGYRAGVLSVLAQMPPSQLESIEKLEQLRWLEAGYTIRTAVSTHASQSVDTPADLEKIIRTAAGGA